MPDTLRDRIAAVLHDIYGSGIGYADEVWDDLPNMVQDDYRRDADAVIAALGLREEREDVASFQPGEIDDSMMPPRQKGRLTWTPSHRYVTDWMSLTDDTTGDVNHD